MFIGVFSVAIVVLIALLGISYSNSDSTNPSIIISIIVLIILAIISFSGYLIHRNHNKLRRRDEDRVKLLKECRDEIFDRLDDHNKIVERCWKKSDENT
jgi:protein-S-isoprenylcysteine O-methyltransferase Ste14